MSDPSPSPAVPVQPGQGPTPDDVISGALQEAINDENGVPGHMVTDWVIVAQVIKPDGKDFTHLRFRDEDVTWPMSVGLIEYARLILAQELEDQVRQTQEEDDE